MGRIRIALAQINTTVGALAGNAGKIRAALGRAAAAGADLVLLPELAVSGYPPEDLLLKPGFIKDCLKSLAEVSPSARTAAVVGFPDAHEGKVFNAAAVIAANGVAAVYHKIELPNYGVFDERRYFSPGRTSLALALRGSRLLLTICEDIWVPGNGVEAAARELGVQAVLNISASPFHAGKLAQRQEIIARFARASHAWVAYANLVGAQDELVFDGGSMVVSPEGKLWAMARRFAEDLLIVDLDLEPATAALAPDRPHRIVPLAAGAPDQVRLDPTIAPEQGGGEEIYCALVVGVRDYVLKNGFSKVVIGLSGGIDSSFTACVAADALGADNVIGVTMPSIYTSAETLEDAGATARNLGLRLITIPIKAVHRQYLDELAGPLQYGEPGVEAENLQARIRGNLLMALSNRFGWLVLTTGNKSEMAVGYATLYGDMAGGFAVIKDVFKTLVYELSELVNRRSGRELIPVSVIQRPPTAELRPDQKDEDSLPPYSVLDPILRAYIEEDKTYDEVVGQGFDPAVVKKVVLMVDRNEYKRRQAPPGVKITPKAFGRDRRLPLTNRYQPG
jgi:NAD+ synthase (glutamine-hydrolysing)